MAFKNIEERRAYRRKWYKLHPEKWKIYYENKKKKGLKKLRKQERNQYLRREYGITTIKWGMLFEKQGRRCANPGCRASIPGYRNWHTDHKPGSNPPIVRGILCHGCNTALGLAKDNSVVLRGLADYLETH